MDPHKRIESHWTETWRQDFLASLVVFLVALPLCMGIALASGAPIAAGLATGIIGGLIVGFFAGAPLQVSGPAAGLTVVCFELIREHGMAALGVAVLLGGMLQLAAGLLRLGQWFRAVSPAVIHGMLSGIGVLILSSQIHVMVDDRPRENGLANLLSIPEALVKGLPLPSMEPVERRRERIAFLQEFGQLHEQQRELASLVERSTTRHGNEALHEFQAEHLADFVPRQQAILEETQAVQSRLAASTIAQADRPSDAAFLSAAGQATGQLAAALDDLQEHRLEDADGSQAAASQSLANVLNHLKSHDWAAKVGLVAILIIIGWQVFAPKKLRLLPGPLLAVLVTTLAAWWLSLPVLYIEVPANLIDGLTFPSLNVLRDVSLWDLSVAGMMIAVVASAETLLCASAVDQMHTGPRTQYDKELAAQGVGNMLCGLVGGLPMTGVIVRSATNVQAGAKSRLSSILHGVWLLTFVVLLGSLLSMIPISALAGILVYTGFKLINWKGFFHLWKTSRTEAGIFLVTVIVIVVEDLLVGVVTGVVLSAIKLLVTFSHLEVNLSPAVTGKSGHERARMTLSGAATFLRLPVLAAKLEQVPPGTELHVEFDQLDYIDHACLDLLMNWSKQHESTGGRLIIDWGQLHARFKENGRGKTNGSVASSSSGTPSSEDNPPATRVSTAARH
ncbi:MAG: SulP family inorganic anion transporter [Pirellulaceae bacterium]